MTSIKLGKIVTLIPLCHALKGSFTYNFSVVVTKETTTSSPPSCVRSSMKDPWCGIFRCQNQLPEQTGWTARLRQKIYSSEIRMGWFLII